MTRRTVALCALAPSPAAATSKTATSSLAAARRVRQLLRVMIRTSLARVSRRPLLDDGRECVQPVGQRGRPGLQNERRFDLAQEAVAHGGNFGEARPRRDFVRYKLFAAPGADDDLGIGADHILGRYNAFLGVLAPG